MPPHAGATGQAGRVCLCGRGGRVGEARGGACRRTTQRATPVRPQALEAEAATALQAAAAALPAPGGGKAAHPTTDSALSLEGGSEATSAQSRRRSEAEAEADALTAEFEKHVVVM